MRKFVDAYTKEPNATKAALAAGYSAAGAAVQGSRLLRNAKVRAVLDRRRTAMAERAIVDGAEVIIALKHIALADPRRFVKWTPTTVTLKSSRHLTDAEARCVAEVVSTPTGIRLKFHDKMPALRMLGQYLGLFQEPIVDWENLTDEQLEAIAAGRARPTLKLLG